MFVIFKIICSPVWTGVSHVKLASQWPIM